MRAVRFKGKTYACNKFSWWLKRPLYLLFGFSRNRFQHFEIMFLTTSCLQPKSMCLAKWFGIGSKEYHIFPISVCATSICLFVWRGCKTADLCDVAAKLLFCVTWLRICWFVWRGCETADLCGVAAKLLIFVTWLRNCPVVISLVRERAFVTSCNISDVLLSDMWLTFQLERVTVLPTCLAYLIKLLLSKPAKLYNFQTTGCGTWS